MYKSLGNSRLNELYRYKQTLRQTENEVLRNAQRFIHKSLPKIEMKRIVLISFIFLLLSCSTQKKYYLKSDDFVNKKITFSLQEGSNYQKVDKFGEHIGNSKDPNIYEVFRESVEEVSNETKINIIYSNSFIFPTGSNTSVIVNITNIDWIFNEPKTTMNVSIDYKLPDDRTIKIIGVHEYKIFVAGTKSGNLRKALKDGHKQFLSTL